MLGPSRLSPRLLLLGAAALAVSCGALGISASGALSASSLGASSAAAPHLGAVLRPSRELEAASSAVRILGAPRAAASGVPRTSSASSTSGSASPCRSEMVLVDGTCVDRFEAHLLEPRSDGTLAPFPAHQRPEREDLVAACAAGVKPQAFISQREASSACRNAGKRLCKLTEWYRACTGSAKTVYPYGARYEAKRCNVGRPHLLSLLHGASSTRWSYADFNDPRLATTEGFLAPTGQYDGCVTTEGAYDMVGNLHEWVEDLVDRTLPKKLPVAAVIERRIGRNTGNGIFMGGFFSTTNQHGEGCTYTTAAHDPRYHDYSTGFRCCQDPVDE